MRVSPIRHPFAVLRQCLGRHGIAMEQHRLAKILECSAATIQSVELGRLKLSNELAMRASIKTGVSVSWLLNGDPHAPILARYDAGPFTRENFERTQAAIKTPKPDGARNGEECDVQMVALIAVLARRILLDAGKKDDFELAHYKLQAALAEVAKEMKLGADVRRLRDSDFSGTLKGMERGMESAKELVGMLRKGTPFEAEEEESAPLFGLERAIAAHRREAASKRPSGQSSPPPAGEGKASKKPAPRKASSDGGSARKPSAGNSPSAKPSRRRPD